MEWIKVSLRINLIEINHPNNQTGKDDFFKKEVKFLVVPVVGDTIETSPMGFEVKHRVLHSNDPLIAIYLEDIETEWEYDKIKKLLLDHGWK